MGCSFRKHAYDLSQTKYLICSAIEQSVVTSAAIDGNDSPAYEDAADYGVSKEGVLDPVVNAAAVRKGDGENSGIDNHVVVGSVESVKVSVCKGRIFAGMTGKKERKKVLTRH